MVIIHLAKLSLLEKSCKYFKKVMIPELVHKEIMEEKSHSEIAIIDELIKRDRHVASYIALAISILALVVSTFALLF